MFLNFTMVYNRLLKCIAWWLRYNGKLAVRDKMFQ